MASREPFPTDPAEFKDDPRIMYDRNAAAYKLEDDKQVEWEWLPGPGRWIQTTDEADIQKQAEAYKVQGVDEDAPALNPSKKRKDAIEDQKASSKVAKTDEGATATNSKPARANTTIFVTGLPPDVGIDETNDYFKRFGLIQESIEDNEKRIKMYYDDEGNFKGEALITYLAPQSVTNALIFDGATFNRDDPKAPTGVLTITEADFSYKANKDGATDRKPQDGGGKPKKKITKAQIKAKTEEMNRRLADWDDDDPSTLQQTSSRSDKVVVLKHIFTPEDAKNKDTMADIKDDVLDEAERFGSVRNVTLFDQEEDGVVTIRYSNALAARACVEVFDGRIFDGRRVSATIATGNERFKKTWRTSGDREAEENKRLEEYSKYIEGETNDGAAKEETGDGGVKT